LILRCDVEVRLIEAIDVYYGSDRDMAEDLFERLFRDYPHDPYYAAMLGKLMIQIMPSSARAARASL
jgi:lipoprotein NlpI